MDMSFVSAEAKTIHAFFVSIFYILLTLMILVGVLIEYFKIPLGGTPAFSQLIGRALIAAILLAAYPEISNTIAAVADSISDKIGNLNNYHHVLESAGVALKEHSWSWTSIGDTLLSVVSYLAYLILYLTVYFFNAAIVYCLILLYVFSPILIAMYVLPQTASMTTGMFRTLFEIAAWKIVWSVLGTLLWSTALNNFKNSGSGNFITLLALTLILVFSVILTPLVVKSLISGSLSSMASQTAGLAALGLSAGFLSPGAIAGLTSQGTKKAGASTLKGAAWAGSKMYGGAKSGFKSTQNQFRKQFKSQKEELPDNVIPFPEKK